MCLCVSIHYIHHEEAETEKCSNIYTSSKRATPFVIIQSPPFFLTPRPGQVNEVKLIIMTHFPRAWYERVLDDSMS